MQTTDEKKIAVDADSPFTTAVGSTCPALDTKNEFDKPCPGNITGDALKDHPVHEWVLNHLPWESEEQKAKFISLIVADARVEQLKAEKESSSQDTTLKRRTRRRTAKPYAREQVKDSTKQGP